MAQIADARHCRWFAKHHRPLPCRSHHGAVVGDAEPSAHARLLVDVLDRVRHHVRDHLAHARRVGAHEQRRVDVALERTQVEAGLPVLADFFLKQADEERMHAMKFVRYVMDTKGGLAIPSIPAPKAEFTSAAEAVQAALDSLRNRPEPLAAEFPPPPGLPRGPAVARTRTRGTSAAVLVPDGDEDDRECAKTEAVQRETAFGVRLDQAERDAGDAEEQERGREVVEEAVPRPLREPPEPERSHQRKRGQRPGEQRSHSLSQTSP